MFNSQFEYIDHGLNCVVRIIVWSKNFQMLVWFASNNGGGGGDET